MATLYCITDKPHHRISLRPRLRVKSSAMNCDACGDALAVHDGGIAVDLGDGPRGYCNLYCVAQLIFFAMFGTTKSEFEAITKAADACQP